MARPSQLISASTKCGLDWGLLTRSNRAAGEQKLPGPMRQAVEPKLQAATLACCAEQLNEHKGPDRGSL